MHRRHRQIDDHVDVGRREQSLDGFRANAKLVGPRFRCSGIDVRAGAHLDALEQRCEFQVGGRDVAAADDSNAKNLCHAPHSVAPADPVDRSRRKALRVRGIVMFHDHQLGRRMSRDLLEQSGPVHRAVADIGPAVLVGALACGRDVLDMDRGDAVAMAGNPVEGIGAAADDPGDVGFPVEIRRGVEQDLHRQAAVDSGDKTRNHDCASRSRSPRRGSSRQPHPDAGRNPASRPCRRGVCRQPDAGRRSALRPASSRS